MKEPGPVFFYRLMCAWIAVVHLGIIALGWFAVTFQPGPDTPPDAPLGILGPGGWLLILMGVGFGALNVWLALAKPKPWYWVAGITNIVAGILCCPLSAILLFFWFRPDVKQHFETLDRPVL